MEHFNKLSPGEAERLAMLAEEAAEVAQAALKIGQVVGKILRHGYNSYHPDEPHIDNRDLLSNEIIDMLAVLHLMENNDDLALDFDLDFDESNVSVMEAVKRKLRYSHHQDDAEFIDALPGKEA